MISFHFTILRMYDQRNPLRSIIVKLSITGHFDASPLPFARLHALKPPWHPFLGSWESAPWVIPSLCFGSNCSHVRGIAGLSERKLPVSDTHVSGDQTAFQPAADIYLIMTYREQLAPLSGLHPRRKMRTLPHRPLSEDYWRMQDLCGKMVATNSLEWRM